MVVKVDTIEEAAYIIQQAVENKRLTTENARLREDLETMKDQLVGSAHIRDRLVHADNFDFLRESVQWFATVMEVVLRKNDHKGGWENEPFQYFIDRMRDELSEIEGAIANLRPSDGDLIDLVNECADLANFAMMLAENAHRKAMEWDEEECEHGRE
jgi:hypothetical protein